jgi:death-on-curing protein
MGRAFEVLTVDEVVAINWKALAAYGGMAFAGCDNMINPEPLRYVLEAVQGSVFGHDPYPTLVEKAAAVAWAIIRRHVFYDGNKRTGLLACLTMLELNGLTMRIDSEVIPTAVSIANGTLSLSEFAAWLAARTEPLPGADRL